MSAVLDKSKGEKGSQPAKNYAYPSDIFLVAHSEVRSNQRNKEYQKELEKKVKEES